MPSANRITLLRDADGDGIAEVRSAFLTQLNSPFGITLVGDQLYVANTDAVMRYPYKEGETEIKAPGTKVIDLPAGPFNHHWTKNVIASRDGSKLYATVGSNSNVGENGLSIGRTRGNLGDRSRSKEPATVCSGLRNPNGMAWEPTTGMLWTVVNERDDLGHNLVPDYLTSVRDGGFYGWPWSYFGTHVDERVEPKRPDMVAKAIVPDYALGSHVAALGLTHSAGNALPRSSPTACSWTARLVESRTAQRLQRGLRSFAAGRPAGQPIDVLSGFVAPTAKRTAARWVLRLTGAEHCWWPTTLATSSGG